MPSFKCIAQPASEKMTVTCFADRKHIVLIIIENVHSMDENLPKKHNFHFSAHTVKLPTVSVAAVPTMLTL